MQEPQQQPQKVFEVVSVPGKGHVMIATQDLLPGHAVLEEQPLVVVIEGTKNSSDVNGNWSSNRMIPHLWAVYQTCQRLPESKKETPLQLFHTSTTPEETVELEQFAASISFRDDRTGAMAKAGAPTIAACHSTG